MTALALQTALAIVSRTTAWTEVTTPAYLCSRGLLLYRAIKFAHTPATIAALAAVLRLFGVHTWVLKAFPLLLGLVAHTLLLRETRPLSLSARAAGSALFLAIFYGWGGNAVWPTVVIAALALPAARCLAQEKFRGGGLLLGSAILFKQTAAYALFAAVGVLLLRRRFRAAVRVFLWGCLPYAAAAVVFAALGAGREFVEWTLIVPFTVLKGTTDAPPGAVQILQLALVFVPLLLAAGLEEQEGESLPTGWLVVLSAGFALMTYPRYSVLNALGATPLLCLGAARLADARPVLARLGGRAIAAVLAISQLAVFGAGETFDGRIVRWNEDPAFNELAAFLRRSYPGYSLRSEVWGNLLPACGMLPPGNLYVHFWEWYSLPVDSIGARIDAAAARPGTITVRYRRPGSSGISMGPYAIEVRPGVGEIGAGVSGSRP